MAALDPDDGLVSQYARDLQAWALFRWALCYVPPAASDHAVGPVPVQRFRRNWVLLNVQRTVSMMAAAISAVAMIMAMGWIMGAQPSLV
jgi:hypothetical protein